MSVRAHSRWLRGALLAVFGSGCQVVLGDFTIGTDDTTVTLAAECRPNAYRCNGATLELCADDRSGYRAWAECASPDQCDPTAGACRPCEPGEYACNENVLLSCSGAATWTQVEAGVCATPELCQTGADRRTGAGCLDVCTPGAVRCGEADRFERCAPSGERWELVERCGIGKCTVDQANGMRAGCLPAACEGAACPPPECENGSLRCDPTSRLTLQRCNSAGRFVTLEACAASTLCRADLGRCLPPACERNEKRCLGQKFQSCRADRAWFQTTKECGPGETCDPTSGCVQQTCANGAVRCNGAALEHCENGAWSPRQICLTKDLCDPTGCKPPVCGGTLGPYWCDGSITRQCASGRNTWEEIRTCGSGEMCVEERPFCVPMP
jgi:hypothetical protein